MEPGTQNLFQFVQDATEAVFLSAWASETSVRLENRPWEPTDSAWVRLGLDWGHSQNICVGNSPVRIHEGNAAVELFALSGAPRSAAEQLAAKARLIFSERSLVEGRFQLEFGSPVLLPLEVRWGRIWCAVLRCPFVASEKRATQNNEPVPSNPLAA